MDILYAVQIFCNVSLWSKEEKKMKLVIGYYHILFPSDNRHIIKGFVKGLHFYDIIQKVTAPT